MRTTRSLIIFALFVSALFAAAPLTATNTTHIPQQVFAIHMDTAAEEEQEVIVDQGVIASAKSPQIVPSPNEQIQQATILPYRNDGSIYQGVLTFTATKPVDVTFSHRLSVDNATVSQIDNEIFGELFVRQLAQFPGNTSAVGRFVPDYSGSAPPYFSASIPFVASTVVLRTNYEPFIASYGVYAETFQPREVNHLGNATVASTNTTSS
jgi:hypothetical protein